MQPYGQQPTRLLCPQDSLGKNTGVGFSSLALPKPLETIGMPTVLYRSYQFQETTYLMPSPNCKEREY